MVNGVQFPLGRPRGCEHFGSTLVWLDFSQGGSAHPSRQPQRGPAAPYHGRLGAATRWGDKVRVEGPANGELLGNDNES